MPRTAAPSAARRTTRGCCIGLCSLRRSALGMEGPAARNASTPYRPRHVHDELQLVTLLLHGDLVAVHRAAESALRAERELLDRRVLRGLLDAALEIVGVLELAELGGHQSQHHGLVLRQEAQGLEVPGTRIV